MKNYALLTLILVTTALGFSCSNAGKNVQKQFKLPDGGVVHAKIHCAADSAKTYALYIPKGITGTGKNSASPCIIAFDPHGDGALPVTRYKDLAEKYGFILMGSNNCKNGMAPADIDSIVRTLFYEARNNFPADSNRIYLMGFSGGARIATLSGLYKVPAKGVISCGAGLAGAGSAPAHKVDYYGMAGMADFNMNEIMELEYPLTQAGLRHVLTTFDGIHAWPPVENMELAFQWFMINAMKDNVLPKDNALLTGIMTGFDKIIDSRMANGLILDAGTSCLSAISFATGLLPTDKYDEKLRSVEESAGYKAQAEFRKKTMADEDKERKMVMDALTTKDMAWWQTYHKQFLNYEKLMQNYAGMPKKSLTMEEWKKQENDYKQMRLLAFIRLLAYMNATSVLTSKNEAAAVKIISIYALMDPDNPEPFYMKAMLHARKSENGEAMKELKTAVEKGFTEKLRMTEQPEFDNLKSSAAFYDLLQKIK